MKKKENFISKTTKEPQGDIAFFNLKDWWRDSFTDEERKHIVEIYQPMGASKDSLVIGEVRETSARVLGFLTCLTGWFDNPRDRHIAHKIIAKAAEYAASEYILDLHFYYPVKMKLFYKNRDNDPNALQTAIDSALKQIEIAEKAATAFKKEYPNSSLPAHEGYSQLCIILEKQGKFEDAIKLAEQAKRQGWSGDWDGRVKCCRKKLERSLKN